MKVAVVGGGIVGLTTALKLNSELRNSNITVLAESYDDLVSYVAAGLFRVGHTYSGPTEEITEKLIKDSYSYYDEITKNYEPIQAGVGQSEAYMFSNFSTDIVQNKLMESVVPIYRKATDEEFNLIGKNHKYGCYFTTVVIQCQHHIPWAMNKLKAEGTNFVIKKIKSLKELADDYDFVFNCSGFGARELCSDKKMIPIRGQVIKVHAPWVKATFYSEIDTYIIPGVDGSCTLGGTRNFETFKKIICPYDTKSIRERCEELLPSLSKAKTLKHAVGLRPHREGGVRIEIEKLSNGRRKTNVVHNYGHGGYGVSTAPGTAQYAVELAKDYHKSSNSKL
ncbi:D-aspartate oxidase [Microplitis mediator]|uniref:D-aspartate oxidase n=1 Tax=Microplitis mediator TaxID=375433 RepID=UPI002553E3E1|nr:D-aspartate oxidase [Microplitis mediator]